MELKGEQRIGASRDQVWAALNDPEILRQSIPGCQTLEKLDDDHMRATVEVKIGPIGARFNGAVTLSDRAAPESYRIAGEGNAGAVGTAKGGALVSLAEDGAGTLLSYEVTAQVSGRLAQLGGPIIDATAKQLSAKFFAKFGELVEKPVEAPVVEAAPPESAKADGPGSEPVKEAVSPVVASRPVVPPPAPIAPPQRSAGPGVWLLAVLAAALIGFLVGHAQAPAGAAEWIGLSIGLLVVLVAGVAFEQGRKSAAPVVVIDSPSAAALDVGQHHVKPAPFDYVVPSTVDAAVQALAEAGGGATVLAGGQTLLPLLALRMSQPFILVDINRIAGMAGITNGSESTRIAAVTRQNDALADSGLAEAQPVVIEALRHVGHHQTRNRGTIGGSIALGEAAAELPATALALGAEIEAHSVRGQRRIAADGFYLGPYMTALEPDELLTAVHFPHWPAGTVTVFREVTQRPGDFALVGLVGALHVEAGRVVRAGLAWFGMGPTPLKARQAEAALTGLRLGEIDLDAIAELAIADADPFDDQHATADYRRTVGRRIFAKTVDAAIQPRSAA